MNFHHGEHGGHRDKTIERFSHFLFFPSVLSVSSVVNLFVRLP